MPLLINNDDTFDVKINYIEKSDGNVEFLEKDKTAEGMQEAVFTFKRPNWDETRQIFSSAVFMNAADGQAVMDPYRLMDARVKLLIRNWKFSNKGEEVKFDVDSVKNLHPELIQRLFNAITETLGDS